MVKLGSIASKTVLLYLFTTAFAVMIAIFFGWVFNISGYEGEVASFNAPGGEASLYDTVVSNQANIDDSDSIKSLLKTSYDDVSTLNDVNKQTLERFFTQNIASDPKTISQFKSNYSQKRKVKNLLTSSTDVDPDRLYKRFVKWNKCSIAISRY